MKTIVTKPKAQYTHRALSMVKNINLNINNDIWKVKVVIIPDLAHAFFSAV